VSPKSFLSCDGYTSTAVTCFSHLQRDYSRPCDGQCSTFNGGLFQCRTFIFAARPGALQFQRLHFGLYCTHRKRGRFAANNLRTPFPALIVYGTSFANKTRLEINIYFRLAMVTLARSMTVCLRACVFISLSPLVPYIFDSTLLAEKWLTSFLFILRDLLQGCTNAPR
jgi:hypothetical protein